MRYFFLYISFLLFPYAIYAQNEGILQINDELHNFLIRQQTSGLLPNAFLNHQPLSGSDANQYLRDLDVQRAHLSSSDQTLLDQFLNKKVYSSTKKVNKILPFLYKNSNAYAEMKGDDYALQLNPLAYYTFGSGAFTSEQAGNSSRNLIQKTRGIRAAGHIGKSVFFETRITGNLVDIAYPEPTQYYAQRIGFTHYASPSRYDYFQAMGMVGFKSKHFEVRFGRDNNRWAEGMNSVILSNYAPVYDQLQIRTTVGKVQYVNLFTAMNDVTRWAGGDTPMPRKFGTFHSLTIRPLKSIEVGVFESIMFAPTDKTNLRRFDYDISYLNPIIFYRAVEHDRGSPDNALVGASGSIIPFKGVKLYGQLMLDEFVASNIKAQNGWWANKWATLAGIHLVPNAKLEARAEFSSARPFMYSHNDASNAYIHHDSILGLQGGPNSKNYLFYLNYQPTARLVANITTTYRDAGRNPLNKNFGADATLSYVSPDHEFGNEIGQGIQEKTLLIESRIGFEWISKLFLEAGVRYQNIQDAEKGEYGYTLPFIQLRWGMPFQYQRY